MIKKIDKINLIIVIVMFFLSVALLITGFMYYDESKAQQKLNHNDNITSISDYNDILAQNLEEFKISGNFKVGEEIKDYALSKWHLLYLDDEPFLYVEKKGLDIELTYDKEYTTAKNGEVHLIIKCYSDSEYARIVDSKVSWERYLKALDFKKKGLIFSTIGFILFFITLYRVIGFITKKPACECQIGPPLQ